MKQRIGTIQEIKTVLAPHLRQSIEILRLPLMELCAVVEAELMTNPLLETTEDLSPESCADTDTQTGDSHQDEAVLDRQIQALLDLDKKSTRPQEPQSAAGEEESPPWQDLLQKPTNLQDHLLRQIRFNNLSETEMRIAEYLIGNLNENGYLTVSCEETAEALRLPDIRPVEKVLSLIQSSDPLGVGARNLQECLLLQVDEKIPEPLRRTVRAIIEHHLPELGRKQYITISRRLKCKPDMVREAAKAISRLNPRPGRDFESPPANLFIRPDVAVHEDNGGYRVELVQNALPPLRINRFYKKLYETGRLTPTERKFFKEKLHKAMFFIKSIEQRHQTILKIAEYIVKKQQNFFKEGSEALVPMGLKDAAAYAGCSISTVSRALHQKYIQTPQGLFPMKFFFTTGLRARKPPDARRVGKEGEETVISNRAIKEAIKELIENEDKKKPLSDSAIQRHFARQGIQIARRTVAKYRQQYGILPAHLRKQAPVSQ